MVNTRSSYSPAAVRAARHVFLELTDVLAGELNKMVVVGGLACALLFPQDVEPHEGTIDIDLVLPADLDYDANSIEEKLTCALYQQVEGQAYRWDRRLAIDGNSISVMVDLLCGEYDGDPPVAGLRSVAGTSASVLRGMDLALIYPQSISVHGTLPDGREHAAEVRVCHPASLIAMKGIAILNRKRGADKDAVDIDYVLRRYEGGPSALARVLEQQPYSCEPLVDEGLRGIAEAFRSPDALGPKSIATPLFYPYEEEREIVRQSAYQRVQTLLRALGRAEA